MSLILDDFPIERKGRKNLLLILMILGCLVSWPLTFYQLALDHWQFGVFFRNRYWPRQLFWNFAPFLFIIFLIRRRATLRFDQCGVRLTANGRSRVYLWDAIDRTRQVSVNSSSGKMVTQIIRRGQIILDKKTDLIWGDEFGLTNDEIVNLIHLGCEQWGGAKEG